MAYSPWFFLPPEFQTDSDFSKLQQAPPPPSPNGPEEHEDDSSRYCPECAPRLGQRWLVGQIQLHHGIPQNPSQFTMVPSMQLERQTLEARSMAAIAGLPFEEESMDYGESNNGDILGRALRLSNRRPIMDTSGQGGNIRHTLRKWLDAMEASDA
ncbi:hypothetical protein CDV55_106240 [Aspergillus turcosus]|nr:hypothetical protein CDV55_106240 [Aspergillus turcosus]